MRISDWSSDVCSSDLLGISPANAAHRGIDASFFPTHGMAATSRRGHVATRSISGLPMDNITKQDRITLKNLKVADFASEETMCFSATVVFDGTPLAEARTDGHGGSTFPPAPHEIGTAHV